MMKSNIGHLAVYTRYTINRCAGFYSAVCADISQEVTKYHVANRGGHPIRVKKIYLENRLSVILKTKTG